MPTTINIDRKYPLSAITLLVIVAIISATLLRVSLLVLYPLVTMVVVAYYRFRVSPSMVIMFGLIVLILALSVLSGLRWRYNLLSLYYIIPFLILLFCSVPAKPIFPGRNLGLFIQCLTAIVLINDIAGLIQIIRTPNSDDSFTGIYSEFSISINGLMLLNSTLFFYYFLKYVHYKTVLYLLTFLFFLTCAMLGFYGAGLVIILSAFILSFFRIRLTSIIKTFFTGGISILLIYFLMLWIKPDTLEYNLKNIRNLIGMQTNEPPRKLLSFSNYLSSYPFNIKDFLFGSGPGTFNSRSAFMIGSPSYFSKPTWIKDPSQPYYFKNFAYTLWNESNTHKEFYQDGFRNQPFSSLLAFLGEYGLIFTIVFFALFCIQYKKVSGHYYKSPVSKEMAVQFRFFKFLCLLLPLLLIIDNYVEYPEIMLLLLLGIKLAELDLSPTNTSTAYVN